MSAIVTPRQMSLLLESRLFSGLSPAQLGPVLRDPRCIRRRFQRDTLIFGGKQFERSLGILLSGRLRVLRTNHDGRKMQVSTQLPGAIFGMAVLFCQADTFPTELHCETVCDVLFLSEELLTDLMRQEVLVAENYIRYLSSRIAFLNGKIAGLSAGDSVHRLAQWLLTHADGCTVAMPPMARLASELNIGRASLYRAMDALESSGALRREPKSVTLLDPAQLQGLQQNDTLD